MKLKRIKILPRVAGDFERLAAKMREADLAQIGHYTEYGFMDTGIRFMNPESGKAIGRALTVRIPAQESKALHLAVSMAREDDIIVIDRCGDRTHAAIGEMVALCASQRKAAAMIVDGPVTDIKEIREIGIPVFARGTSGLTTKFIDDDGVINDDISCGGVVVHAGDAVMADDNGVFVFPRDVGEAEAFLDKALADSLEESKDRELILAGKTLRELYVPDAPELPL
jgi:regulator of RNase E activity RraA